MDTRRKKNILIIALLIAVLTMSISYALLSQQLEINGSAKINTKEWNVKIVKVEDIATQGNAEAGSTDHTGTVASISPVFYTEGDSVTYSVTVENQGSIDATLDSITSAVSTTEGTNYPNVEYEYEGIKATDILKAGDSVKFNVTISYVKADQEVTTAVQSDPTKIVTLTSTLVYVQSSK